MPPSLNERNRTHYTYCDGIILVYSDGIEMNKEREGHELDLCITHNTNYDFSPEFLPPFCVKIINGLEYGVNMGLSISKFPDS